MRTENVRVDLIELEAGTQQRKIDPNLVEQYQNLMKDGQEFPPLEIVRDGAVYILVDGFHRLKAIVNLGAPTCRAFVTQGKQRDAIWSSFAANKLHGQPRPHGSVKKIVTSILSDSSWAKKSLKVIAEHVGTTRDYVKDIQQSMRQATKQHEQRKASSQAVKGEKGGAKAPPCVKRDKSVTTTSARGKKVEQKSQAKEHKKPVVPKDAAGNEIPEKLQALYASRDDIWKQVSALSRIRDTVNKAIANRDPAWTLLNTTAFQSQYENLRRTLKSAMPHATCCYCGGKGKKCKACGSFGFLNSHSYKAAPEGMKK